MITFDRDPSPLIKHTHDFTFYFREILNYLDEVDKKCDRTLEVVKHGSEDTNSEVDFVYEPDFTEDIPK